MKNFIITLSILPLLAATACAGAQAKAKAAQYKNFTMDNNYFSCQVPADWSQERDKDKDEEYKIYEVQLMSPKAGKAPTFIKVSYYSKDNADFNGIKDFVDSNSKNALGETKSARELYEPVKAITLAGRKAQLLARERMVFLHPESKSDESVQLKEKLYVLPAKAGFYVLHFSAPKDLFLSNQSVFEKVAKSFKGLP